MSVSVLIGAPGNHTTRMANPSQIALTSEVSVQQFVRVCVSNDVIYGV